MNESTADRIEAEAARWLARLDASPESADETAAFEAWRSASPEHDAAYRRLHATWRRLDRINALRPGIAEPVFDDLLAPRPRAFALRRLSIAAMLVLAVGLGALVLDAEFQKTPEVQYAASVGERRHLQLEDRSTVTLNTDSSVVVRYRQRERDVELRSGEAHFKVEKDASRPFVVKVRDLRVRAVGTAFAVRIRDHGVEVLVDEGVVAVTRDGVPAPTSKGLGAGQVGFYADTATADRQPTIRNLTPVEVSRKLAWEEGHLAFAGETLAQAVTEFNRYNRNKMVVADPALESLRIGGHFKVNDGPAFVHALTQSFDIEAVESPDGTVMLRAKSSN